MVRQLPAIIVVILKIHERSKNSFEWDIKYRFEASHLENSSCKLPQFRYATVIVHDCKNCACAAGLFSIYDLSADSGSSV